MKLELSGLSYEAKWFDYKGGKLEIRMYPASLMNLSVRDGAIVLTGEDSIKIFKYCLTGWKDYVDAQDKPIPLTDEVKQKLYDFKIEGISDFVINTNTEMSRQKEAAEKN